MSDRSRRIPLENGAKRAERYFVMDQRALVSLTVGIAGFVLGIIAAAQGAVLGVFSGVAALGAGLIGWVISRQLRDTESQLSLERRQADGLEESVTSQVQARISAEDAVRSLSAELSATQQTEVERAERIEAQIRDDVARSPTLLPGSTRRITSAPRSRLVSRPRVATLGR